MKKALTFDDVALVPQYNNVPSRTEPTLETWLTKSLKLQLPLLAANMESVISEDLADVLLQYGGMPIFHRFCDLEIQKKWVKKYKEKTFVSCGLHKLDEVRSLLDLGALGVCIDIAHGHSEPMLKFVAEVKRTHPESAVIAGNVCTAMGYNDLVNAGADAVKVGVGPGAACTTRMVTGFGVPQFTAIRDCAVIAEKLRVPLIADGGIKGSREVVLALAAGASTVMLGKLFSLTKESAALKKNVGGILSARYRGQASEDFQKDYYGGLKEKTVAEGTDFWAEVSGSAKELIDNIIGGLRSGLTYAGARSIKELQRKAEFVEVVGGYLHESMPRK